MAIKNDTIGDFLNNLASASPTPGGGTVAALTAATAAALIEMVANLTKGDDLKDAGQKSGELKARLLGLGDADAAAFDAVMEAYRSKDTERIKAALTRAIEVPAETRELAVVIQNLATEAIEKGNKNAVSDAKTALYLAEAAEKSAEENVGINKLALAKLK